MKVRAQPYMLLVLEDLFEPQLMFLRPPILAPDAHVSSRMAFAVVVAPCFVSMDRCIGTQAAVLTHRQPAWLGMGAGVLTGDQSSGRAIWCLFP